MVEEKIENFSLKDHFSGLEASLKYVKTMFGDINEQKVTFCFDNSGSMYRINNHFRDHLVEKLFQMFFSRKSQLFNIVLFNTSIHQCFKNHVDCTEDNIMHAMTWMKKGYYESSSDMLAGLNKSFEGDPDVVYLITDGFPSNDRQDLLNYLPYITKGRPIRSILITSKVPPETCALDLLEDITEVTNGSLTVINISDYGAVEVVMPVYYESRPIGIRRSAMNSSVASKMDLVKIRSHFKKYRDSLTGLRMEPILKGDPMDDLPLVVPFVKEDPLSGKDCPFYHPFNHWYWPQYWHKSSPGPFTKWVTQDPQYECMLANFRESRAFIGGRKYLESQRNPKHMLPYSGMMLINKRVLACNHNDSNNYYIGKVTSQVSHNVFLVKFDKNEDFNEVQKTDLREMIDYEEQKRHSVNVGDYVLAPLKSEKEAFSVAIVLEGKENKEITQVILPSMNVPLTVRFLSNDMQKQLDLNQAVFISDGLKNKIEQCLYSFTDSTWKVAEKSVDETISMFSKDTAYTTETSKYGTNNNCLEENRGRTSDADPYCICNNGHHNCCCVNKLYSGIDGRVASPVDDGKAVTLDQIREQIKVQTGNKEHETENRSESRQADICDTCEEEEEEEEMKYFERNKDYFSSEDDDTTRKGEYRDEFTETDLNWCILRLLNKHSKQQTESNKRPPWKYWGKPGIPDVIDPPTTEPYNNPPNWGCLMPKPAVEWPSSTFHEVDPHQVTCVSPRKMFHLFKHEMHKPSNRLKRDACVGRDVLPPEESTKRLLERRFRNVQGGYLGSEIKNPYRDSVKPIISSWSAIGSVRHQNSNGSYLNLLEKSRIESQIQRDESNILRYVENKPSRLQPSVQFR